MLNKLRVKAKLVTQHLKAFFPVKKCALKNRFVPLDERQCCTYKNKIILAPMVRVGFLPARLLALRYGADLVYTDETFSQSAGTLTRKVNDDLGTIDYISGTSGQLWFRTCEEEKQNLVLQLGTKDAQCALRAAKQVEQDVLAVDVNMGCPAASAIAGGTGSALLDHPDKIESILRTLVDGLSVPVTCKIRVYPSLNETLELVKMIESTGVSAIAVHGRTRKHRSHHPCRVEAIRAVADTVSVPVIANGGSEEHIQTYDDIEKFRQLTKASSVMIARSAQFNCSIFRKEGILPLDEVIADYLKLALLYDLAFCQASFLIKSMIGHAYTDSNYAEHHHRFLFATTYEETCHLFGLRDFYENLISTRRKDRKNFLYGRDVVDPGTKPPTPNPVAEQSVTMDLLFKRNHYNFKVTTPKSILHQLAVDRGLAKPLYQTVQTHGDRARRSHYCNSTVLFDGVKYRTRSCAHLRHRQRTPALAEQAAAAVCLRSLGIDDGRRPLTYWDLTAEEHSGEATQPYPSASAATMSYEEPLKLRHG